MEEYLGVAEEMGIPTKKVEAAKHIAMAVAAGQVNAQFQEVRSARR